MEDMRNIEYWKGLPVLTIEEYFLERRKLDQKGLLIPKDYLILSGTTQINTEKTPSYKRERINLSLFNESRTNRLETIIFGPNTELIEKILSNRERLIVGVTSGIESLPIVNYVLTNYPLANSSEMLVE